MIELKEWLEFKLSTSEKLIEVEVKIWLEQYNKVNEFDKLLSEFCTWKSEKVYNSIKDGFGQESELIDCEHEYKVGDKVEVVKEVTRSEFKVGDIVTISYIEDECYLCNSSWWFSADEIKPYTPDLIQQQKEWLGEDLPEYHEITESTICEVGDRIYIKSNIGKFKICAITFDTKHKTTYYWFINDGVKERTTFDFLVP